MDENQDPSLGMQQSPLPIIPQNQVPQLAGSPGSSAANKPPKPGLPNLANLIIGMIKPPQQASAPGQLARPASRLDVFENFLGNFVQALGSGLANSGHGPGANFRGAGAAIQAPYQNAITQWQLGQEQNKNEAEVAHTQAQTKQLTDVVQTPYGPMSSALASKIFPASINADAKEKVAGIQADSRENVADKNNSTRLVLGDQKMQLAQKALDERMRNNAARLALSAQSLGLRKSQVAQRYEELSSTAQGILMSTSPAMATVDDLLGKLEGIKTDNTPGYFAKDRFKYAVGMDSDGGVINKSLSELELNRVLAGTRLLKGGSRAYQALQLAMKHAPDAWKDSPQLMYNKLSTIKQSLQQAEDAAQLYGRKGGGVSVPTKTPQAAKSVTAEDLLKMFPPKRR